jgi:uracil-DNA glycosylase
MELDGCVIHPSWIPLFNSQTNRINKIRKTLKHMRNAFAEGRGSQIFPEEHNVFKVFEMDLYRIKVVILGQDPYIRPGQAMGLSFSVPKGQTIPPSLQNIYKEIMAEYPGVYQFPHGDLTRWMTEEHIFLLNASLTVEEGKSGSQMALWSKWTDNVIRYISANRPDVVFLLMGTFAKTKTAMLSPESFSNAIMCSHPSPLSAYQGFFGSGVFKKVNEKLTCRSRSPIVWRIE